MFLFIVFLFLQLEIEALKLFDAIVSGFSLVVIKVLDMIFISLSISLHTYSNEGWWYGRFFFLKVQA
jgi:hypothetical protein